VSFSFGTVTPGTTYDVTVAANPSTPTQTCVVANGSGVVSNANVTNVAVTCTTNTYALGGTVSGYAGSGLQLRYAVGATPITVPAGATAFSFGNLPSGTAYSVTVATQPSTPTQSCTVTSGGSGTITNGAVSSVQVTCATSSFTLGGSISGLAGTGLQLSSAGLTTQSPAAGATSYSFGSVPSGTAYAISASAQPTGPSQTCSVTNASGTIGGTDVVNANVTCATNSFTVGGTVTGHTGTVVLSSAGVPNVNVLATETGFTFASQLSGTAYAVQVVASPSGQTCTVTSGAGTVGGANVTDVAVSCGPTPPP
jgi:hypothetical protein